MWSFDAGLVLNFFVIVRFAEASLTAGTDELLTYRADFQKFVAVYLSFVVSISQVKYSSLRSNMPASKTKVIVLYISVSYAAGLSASSCNLTL